MSLDIQQIVSLWEKDELEFKELGNVIHHYIKSTITDLEILPDISYRTKDLLSIIKKIKKKSKDKEYKYEDLKDKLGIRIICLYTEDLDKVDSYLKENFIIRKAEYKKDILDFDKLDYTSNHYDASINLAINAFTDKKQFADHVFEIQVRTVNQHAWSNTAHSLAYKQEADIDDKLKRRVYRLLSLYEIADDEFSSVNNILSKNTDNVVYTLVRKLESKIYKYAKIDFDRATSLVNIKTILSFLSENNRHILLKDIESFILNNNGKIIQIFTENRIRFHEISLITQPEIFIIWYCLEFFYFEITDNWENEYERFDLEQVAILWGISLS